MFLRIAAIGMLALGCAHAPVETHRPQTTPAAIAAPSSQPSGSMPVPQAPSATNSVDFARDVKPILESRCRPCHFAGGKVYDRFPFDRPETIREVGLKLFTRIKDEESQAPIRAFLSQGQ
jgi:hypothetical protein